MDVIEAKQLQAIMLKHFDGEVFKDGRIATNVAQVISFTFFTLHKFTAII
jgi:hypothetical protein